MPRLCKVKLVARRKLEDSAINNVLPRVAAHVEVRVVLHVLDFKVFELVLLVDVTATTDPKQQSKALEEGHTEDPHLFFHDDFVHLSNNQ